MLLVPLLSLGLAFQSPAGTVALSPPQLVAEVDVGKLRGELARLAWALDGSQFYLQTRERDGIGNVKSTKHYVVSIAGRTVKSVDQEPVGVKVLVVEVVPDVAQRAGLQDCCRLATRNQALHVGADGRRPGQGWRGRSAGRNDAR